MDGEASWDGLAITIEENAIELKTQAKELSNKIEAYSVDMLDKMERLRANDIAEALTNLTEAVNGFGKRLKAVEDRLPEPGSEAPTIRK